MSFNNPIWIAGQIDNKDFFISFTRRYSELMSQTKKGDEITLFINSPGGETNTSLGIYDLLNKCDRKVTGIVVGIAHSGASLILQACSKRIMTEHSSLMLHKSTVHVTGFVDNAQAALDSFRRLDERYHEIYVAKCGDNAEKIAGMAHSDQHISAQQAVEIGLADEVLKIK